MLQRGEAVAGEPVRLAIGFTGLVSNIELHRVIMVTIHDEQMRIVRLFKEEEVVHKVGSPFFQVMHTFGESGYYRDRWHLSKGGGPLFVVDQMTAVKGAEDECGAASDQ